MGIHMQCPSWTSRSGGLVVHMAHDAFSSCVTNYVYILVIYSYLPYSRVLVTPETESLSFEYLRVLTYLGTYVPTLLSQSTAIMYHGLIE